jgi:hypothetical protein
LRREAQKVPDTFLADFISGPPLETNGWLHSLIVIPQMARVTKTAIAVRSAK